MKRCPRRQEPIKVLYISFLFGPANFINNIFLWVGMNSDLKDITYLIYILGMLIDDQLIVDSLIDKTYGLSIKQGHH